MQVFTKNDLKDLIKESIRNLLCETETEDLSKEDIVVGDRGYDFLKLKMEELNKKAKRWGVPPLELKVIKDELVTKKVWRTLSGHIVSNPAGYPDAEEIEVKKKQYTLRIAGDTPKVDGYEFIAKVEHTDAGNIINIAPNASIKALPSEFKQANAECDVCHTKRERFNTFVLKDEKNGTLIKAGSGCLKRFLPSISVNALINYAHMLEEMREGIRGGAFSDDVDDFDERGRPNKYRNYMPVGYMMNALCAAYIIKGKYISKSKALEFNSQSTVDQAQDYMFPPKSQYRHSDFEEELTRAKELMGDGGPANELASKILNWAKSYDFTAEAEANPDYASLLNNMQVVAHSESTNLKNMPYVAAIIPKYMRVTGELEKKAASGKKPSEFVGTVGSKINNIDVTLLFQREFQGDYGTTILYSFEDATGNRFAWFSSNDLGLVDKQQYKIVVGTVKKQEVSKYGGHKENYLTRVKLMTTDGQKINQ
jgi:acetolactate synthase small subunit